MVTPAGALQYARMLPKLLLLLPGGVYSESACLFGTLLLHTALHVLFLACTGLGWVVSNHGMHEASVIHFSKKPWEEGGLQIGMVIN